MVNKWDRVYILISVLWLIAAFLMAFNDLRAEDVLVATIVLWVIGNLLLLLIRWVEKRFTKR